MTRSGRTVKPSERMREWLEALESDSDDEDDDDGPTETVAMALGLSPAEERYYDVMQQAEGVGKKSKFGSLGLLKVTPLTLGLLNDFP